MYKNATSNVTNVNLARPMHQNTVAYIVLSIGSLCINVIFLTVLFKSWKLVKQKRFTYHVVNLAFADLLVGTSTLVSFTASDQAVRSSMARFTWACTLTSLSAVCIMAIERALIIKRPHDWGTILTLNRTLSIMAAIWLITMNFVILEHVWHRSQIAMRFVLLILFDIAILVTSIMYLTVYWKLYMRRKGIHGDTNLVSAEERKRRLYHRKLSGLVFLLTILLLVTVLPSFLTLLIRHSCLLFQLRCSYWQTLDNVFYYLYMLELLNFIINPLIYFWRVAVYRKAFLHTFGKIKPSPVCSNQ